MQVTEEKQAGTKADRPMYMGVLRGSRKLCPYVRRLGNRSTDKRQAARSLKTGDGRSVSMRHMRFFWHPQRLQP